MRLEGRPVSGTRVVVMIEPSVPTVPTTLISRLIAATAPIPSCTEPEGPGWR
jgi:hypothetical protein